MEAHRKQLIVALSAVLIGSASLITALKFYRQPVRITSQQIYQEVSDLVGKRVILNGSYVDPEFDGQPIGKVVLQGDERYVWIVGIKTEEGFDRVQIILPIGARPKIMSLVEGTRLTIKGTFHVSVNPLPKGNRYFIIIDSMEDLIIE